MKPNLQKLYRYIWSSLQLQYELGIIVSERNLQAALFSGLRLVSNRTTLVEPVWQIGSQKFIPDLIMCESGEVIAIFELKYLPHHYPEYKKDLDKLRRYTELNDEQPIGIDPRTGKYINSKVSKECELHFIAVGQHDSAAVSKNVTDFLPGVNHWYGRISENNIDWDIKFVDQQNKGRSRI